MRGMLANERIGDLGKNSLFLAFVPLMFGSPVGEPIVLGATARW